MLLAAGAYLEWRRYGRSRGLVWLTGLLALPTFAFAVNLMASERYATYRTILAMTAVLVCFLVASVRALTADWKEIHRRLLAALIIATAFFSAQHHAYALIAVPQGNEWQLIVAGAKHVRLERNTRPRIFAIASTPADISTATIYHDEFGSLSSNSEWVPREMFKRAMHDLHPEIRNIDARYDFADRPDIAGESAFRRDHRHAPPAAVLHQQLKFEPLAVQAVPERRSNSEKIAHAAAQDRRLDRNRPERMQRDASSWRSPACRRAPADG